MLESDCRGESESSVVTLDTLRAEPANNGGSLQINDDPVASVGAGQSA